MSHKQWARRVIVILILLGSIAVVIQTVVASRIDDDSESLNEIINDDESNEFLKWTRCFERAQCRKFQSTELGLSAEIDWDLEVVVIPAMSSPARHSNFLFVDAGGPGKDGISAVTQLFSLLSPTLTDTFTLVGWRWTSPDLLTADSECKNAIDLHLQQALAIEEVTTFDWRSCITSVSWPSVLERTQAIDRLRQRLETESVSYLAYSYGSFTALAHSVMHPGVVNSLVLDAPVNPFVTPVERLELQALKFEKAWQNFLESCAY